MLPTVATGPTWRSDFPSVSLEKEFYRVEFPWLSTTISDPIGKSSFVVLATDYDTKGLVCTCQVSLVGKIDLLNLKSR